MLLIAMSAVRWCSVRHREAGNKNPAIADGVVCVRFCREIDSDNHSAPCFSPKAFVWLSLTEVRNASIQDCGHALIALNEKIISVLFVANIA